ncbi:MAG: peptidase [Naasia sp.]|uniref:prepilin peptidase n=1 Tax=Naasia sp. TaxID=2546198 RepID=UPI002630ADEA|nr:A24 family peptidase [Naasia sp.]MCU1570085.1 peptidase [Naasia sp.]
MIAALCLLLPLGLAVGSFLNVVVYRVPRGLSVVRPASACPGCRRGIAAYDNVPVLSWVLLGGRCRGCRRRISARYPLVEALTGVAFLVVAFRFVPEVVGAADAPGIMSRLLALAAFLYLAALSVALSAIDIELRRLPDRIVLPAYLVGVVLLGSSGAVAGDLPALAGTAIGGAASFGLYLLLAVVRPGGMGMGDVKLAGVLGLFLGFLGPAPLLVGVAAAFLTGGVVGIAAVAAGSAGRRTALPFGPFMFAGAWVGILAGEPLAAAYLSLAGIS